eukprot:6210805-Pleurochrysis_carterae.AAC.2
MSCKGVEERAPCAFGEASTSMSEMEISESPKSTARGFLSPMGAEVFAAGLVAAPGRLGGCLLADAACAAARAPTHSSAWQTRGHDLAHERVPEGNMGRRRRTCLGAGVGSSAAFDAVGFFLPSLFFFFLPSPLAPFFPPFSAAAVQPRCGSNNLIDATGQPIALQNLKSKLTSRQEQGLMQAFRSIASSSAQGGARGLTAADTASWTMKALNGACDNRRGAQRRQAREKWARQP